jgi:uncharacterized protein (DUF2336 family)
LSKNTSDTELSYEDSKALVSSDDPAVRASAAARADLKPEALYFLAQDESVDVRRAVATNPSAPHQTFDLLALDKDEDVRWDLVTKIAMLTPQLGKSGDDKLKHSTREALSVLAMDQIVRVRETMASAFKHMDGIPVDVIKALAVDSEVSVSIPVLEHSPILTDEILLEIIEDGTVSDNLCAISRRKTISEAVSGAVVYTNDVSAIGELLNNSSAQIQEEVLDSLIDRAADIDIWHEPLVKRPTLPPNAPQKLAHFIAEQLFETLKSREDMDEKALAQVESVVRNRLENGGAVSTSHGGVFDYLNGPVSMELVDRLMASGGLHKSVISSALQAEDHSFVLAALIKLSDLDEAVVKRVFAERNAKGVIALVWKAGLPASMIVPLQKRMARIPPDDVLETTTDRGGHKETFPLTEKELEWNIQFFSDLVDRDHSEMA